MSSYYSKLLYATEITTFHHQRNSHQVFNCVHFKVFCYFKTIIFYSVDFAKVKINGKDSTKCCYPPTLLPNYKMFKLGFLFHNWRRLPPDICAYANARDIKVQLTRKRISWCCGWLLPPKTLRMFLSISPFFPTILFLILTPWRSLSFFCQPTALPCPGKTLPLFTYLRPLQKQVIQPPINYWIYCDAGDSIILPITNFSLISNASVSLEYTCG